jgi:hypothetical protein
MSYTYNKKTLPMTNQEVDSLFISLQEKYINSNIKSWMMSPCSCIKNDLIETDPILASFYWDQSCASESEKQIKNKTFWKNEVNLNNLDTFEMPSWGYVGT